MANSLENRQSALRLTSSHSAAANALLVGIVLVLGCAPSETRGQAKSPTARKIRLRPDKASIFLSFVRTAETKTDSRISPTQELVLELHNNTRWKLYVDVPVGKHNPGESLIEYRFEDAKGSPVLVERSTDVYYRETLRPGRSAFFRVPRARLMKDYKVGVQFYYAWETKARGTLVSGEPTHRVYFSYYDLPVGVR